MADNTLGFLHGALTGAAPGDLVMSPDGSKVYASTSAGRINVYDLSSRALLDSWAVGSRLGGMDVSPDGRFLMAVEREIVAYQPAGYGRDPRTTVTVYKVDTATGAKTSHPFVIKGHVANSFYDVAVLKDGTAMLSHARENLQLRFLDTKTGTYQVGPSPGYSGDGVFIRSADGSRAILSPSRTSDGELYLFAAGAGAWPVDSAVFDQAYGPSHGIVAYSAAAGRVVQHVYYDFATSGIFTHLYVYGAGLDLKLDLLDLHPEWADGRISGLAFNASGRSLFVLDDDTDSIVQLSTSDWKVTRSFAVGADIGNYADGAYGNRLLVSPDGRYFTVVTATGSRVVENDALANVFTGGAGADSLSAGRGNDTLSGGRGNDQLLGDAGADTLRGDADHDRLDGGSGDDTLHGGEGDDELNGNEGHDKLIGGPGTDVMVGGTGNDVYSVTSSTDRVIEDAAGGYDLVESSISLTLPVNVEKLLLTGTLGRSGQGNSAANTITGNGGANRLSGGAGNDRMDGGGGNDLIYGQTGRDTLAGGAGIDRFYFDTRPGSTNVDSILDFAPVDDTIALARAVFAQAGPSGTLAAAAFHKGAAAHDATDRIIYDAGTGKIYYDADGTGDAAQLLVATVSAGTALASADFLIYG